MYFIPPKFWQDDNYVSRSLAPLAWVYSHLSNWHYHKTRALKLPVPVICVGNLVMGGAGKTPTVIALVEILKSMGHNPHILSRGYGVVIKQSIRVDLSLHNYLRVGDEALLLAEQATTWAGHNRVLSAKQAISKGATVIIMDDGLQNNSLHKDFSILVVDTLQGLGNGRVFPAGPLRENTEKGVEKADVILAIGDGALPHGIDTAMRGHMCAAKEVQARPVIAFAGLGYPEKFNKTLKKYQYDVKKFIPFPDHYPYTRPDLEKLVKIAKRRKADLMTTAKDFIRIPEAFKKYVSVFPVHLVIENQEILQEALLEKIPSLAKST